MDIEKFEIWMIEYLSDGMDEQGKSDFEKFLEDHPEYQKEFEIMNSTWEQMDDSEIPEPTEKMDSQFYQMLYSEIEAKKNTKVDWFKELRLFFSSLQKPQLAFGALLLTVGLAVGYFLNSNTTTDYINTTVVSSQETEEVRGELVLTLLEQPSANKRLQGINEANKIAKADEKVIQALLQTLNNDRNVNVRLAAIESLTNYLDSPMVREGLVQSIVKQDSPIVQITLADLMVALQEKKSIEPFKTLMRTKELDKSVKQKLETSIESII